jgi:NADH-quinone oxidoreductase subunit J
VIVFWLLAPLMVLAALGMVLVRKAVHSALLLAVVMICLAVLYAALDAPFLFVVQIIVYTGAILMLFLFVLMLVGVDSSDSVVETIKRQRLAAAVLGLAFGALLALVVAQAVTASVVGLDEANAGGNVPGLAQLLFGRYILAFELTSALLITAALGAMVLAHRELLVPKPTQRDRARARMRDYREHGRHPGPLATPGVYARHNAVDTPALLPDGTTSELSVSRSLRARGNVRRAGPDDVDRTSSALDPPAPASDLTDRGAGR